MTEADGTSLGPAREEGRWPPQSAAILDALPHGAVLIEAVDPDYPIVYANGAFARWIGCPPEELVGRDWLRMQPLRAEWDKPAELRESMRNRGTFLCELRRRLPDESTLACEWMIRPLADDRVESSRFLAVQTTVVDRRRENSPTSTSERRLRRLVEGLPAGAVLVEGERLHLNRGAEAITGYSRSELGTLDAWFETLNPGRGKLARELYEAGKRTGQSPTSYSPIVRKDGDRRMVEFAGFFADETEVWLLRDVTESLRQARLMEQTERAAHVGGWELDGRTMNVYWSPETYRIHETSPGEYTPEYGSAVSFYAPESLPIIDSAVRRAVEFGEPFDLELEILSAKGNRLWVRAIGKCEMDQGKTVKLYGSFQDVTERKRAEMELRESEERLRLALRAGRMATWDWDLTAASPGNSNEWARLISGAGRGELHPDDLPALGESVLRAIDEKSSFQQDFRVLRSDGVVRWMGSLGRVFCDAAGRPVRMVGTTRDVTDRKWAELALQEREEQLRRLGDNLPDGFVFQLLRLEAGAVRFLYLSAGVERLIGLSPQAILQSPEAFWKRLSDVDREEWERRVEESAKSSTTMDLEIPIRGEKEEIRWMHLRAAPHPESFGAVVWDGVMMDATQRRRSEEERRQIEQKMRETQKLESLGVLAGGIAHDFNNLLTAILGNAELAKLHSPDEAASGPFLDHIRNACLRAADLCKQMLAYAGKGRFVVEVLNLSEVVLDLVDLLRVSIAKQAQLQLALADDSPRVVADATQLRQVIMNLVINASEAIGETGGVIHVSTGARIVDEAFLQKNNVEPTAVPGDYVYLEVSDDGAGMAPETIARIFDPFFTTKFTGRGLGLAAVLGVVRAHRGFVLVRSQVGQGTVFTIYLPAAPASDKLPSSEAPLEVWRGEGTVLVVDDEAPVRRVACLLLESLGFQSVEAADGVEAVEIFQANPGRFSFVLLDLTMPRMGGEEAFRRLQELDSRSVVLITSGYSDVELLRRSHGLGAAGCVAKPFCRSALQKAIQRIVRPGAEPAAASSKVAGRGDE
jgi:PAS domain S-box-containing protein